MRATPALVLLAAAALALAAPVPAHAGDRGDPVDAYVTERMAATGVPGAALSITDGDETLHARQYGRTGDGGEVIADTPFMWGSIAKPMTAVVILNLAEDGDLDIDAPAGRYLDDFRPTWNGSPAEPTIAQLLSHSSGLPGIEGSSATDRDGRTTPVSRVATELDTIELSTEPGTEHTYSSLNYLLLGAIVETVTDRPFRTVLTERVLEPLGMNDVILDADTANRRMPSGNRLWFGHPLSDRSPFDESGIPYGYIGGPMSDLTTFARAVLIRDERLLSPASWEAALSPQTDTSAGHYGFGWSIRESHGEPLVFHTGMTPGFHANLILLPDRDLAVVLTQNAYSEAWALPLRATSEGVARLWTDRRPDPAPGPDSLLNTAPWVLSSIALLLLLLTAVSLTRSHPSRRPRISMTVWTAVAVLVPAAMLWLLPMAIGVSLRLLWLFLPDLAASLVAVSIAAAALAAARVTRAARPRRALEPNQSRGG